MPSYKKFKWYSIKYVKIIIHVIKKEKNSEKVKNCKKKIEKDRKNTLKKKFYVKKPKKS